MELFDKKFVYLEWDDVLEDKEVFVADSLLELRRIVNSNNPSRFGHVCDSGFNFPFLFYGLNYAMAYYDPNYTCKRTHAQDKTVQYRDKDGNGSWRITDNPSWSDNKDPACVPHPARCQEFKEESTVIPEMRGCLY